jgi:hypothetical protein
MQQHLNFPTRLLGVPCTTVLYLIETLRKTSIKQLNQEIIRAGHADRNEKSIQNFTNHGTKRRDTYICHNLKRNNVLRCGHDSTGAVYDPLVGSLKISKTILTVRYYSTAIEAEKITLSSIKSCGSRVWAAPPLFPFNAHNTYRSLLNVRR